MTTSLPIDASLPALREAVRRGNVVLHAPTGAGKTTRVPPALLDVVQGTILVLEPRRIAARAAAQRMAAERGERVGDLVGFQVRFERKVGPRTRILVATEGVALRQLIGDPLLEGIGCIVVDEIHERSLDADLVLALARHTQREVRDDLRIVAMSATLDTERLAAFLDATIVRSRGRSYPVDTTWLATPDDRPVADQVADGVRTALEQVDGDVLAFLPGVREIAHTAERLTRLVGVDVLPLHGRLSGERQDAALRPGPRRRVVLATNVAETSVTIPGVRAVVDSGLVRRLEHDVGRGLDKLVTARVSQASADQRAGRAGRTAPGIALRLWTERQHAAMPDHDLPEVQRIGMEGALLALLAWGEPDPHRFPWLDAPREHAVDAGMDLLRRLGAVDTDGQLLPDGRVMADLPAHPRIGRALVEAHRLGVLDEASAACALLQGRLPFRRDRPTHRSDDDLADLVEALRGGASWGWVPVGRGPLEEVKRAAAQLHRATVAALGPPGPPQGAVAAALLTGWPDRVARQRQDDAYTLASGRGARLHRSSAVRDLPWLLAVEVVDTDGQDASIRLASRVEVDWLEAPDVVEVRYDASRDRVVGARRARWGALVLREQEGVQADPAAVEAALLHALAASPDRGHPSDDVTLGWMARLRFLHRARPDFDLPPCDAEGLGRLARTLVPGCRSLADLRKRDWVGALLGQLTWPQRQQLDALAPATITVPSGSAITVTYPDDGPPRLAVRMQELFGWRQTPQVAGVPVVLHLLAPNGRPQQVTDDLEGFWARQWPEIRKELRGRYPRHPWPEDPASAPAWRPGMKRRDRS